MTKTTRKRKLVTRDRFALYEASVQSVEHDVDIFEQMFHTLSKRKPHSLREDFCGTFALSVEWVKKHKENTALALDISERELEYGRKHHLVTLDKEQQKRLRSLRRNVLSKTPPVDLIAACNFSYLIFRTRAELLNYFRHCYRSLKADGCLLVDIFGGTEAELVAKERRFVTNDKIARFTYIWELEWMNPITREGLFHIHFKFPNKKPINKAFSYHWRIWTVPEIREIMEEAGFAKSVVFWEEGDENGEGTGTFYPSNVEENDPSWIAFIVARKQ
jgi:SAM-dependent methyltransferase